MLIKVSLISVLSIVIQHSLVGQTTVIPAEYEDNTSLVSLFDATIVSPNTKQTVYLFASISIPKETIITVFSKPFSLPKGIYKLNGKNLPLDSGKCSLISSLWGEYFLHHSTLPQGQYQIRWNLYNESDSLLATFGRNYTSKNCVQIKSINDSTEGNLVKWGIVNDPVNGNIEDIKASITFFTLKKGEYKLLQPIVSEDSLVEPFFSPGQLLIANYKTEKNQTYFYQVNVYYNGLLVGKSDRAIVSKPFDISSPIEEKKAFGFLLPDNPIEKEKGYWLGQYQTTKPKKNDALKISGSIGSESGYSNIKYPYQISPPIYSRLFVNPTLTYLGIPITAKVFLSTENNTHYPVNSFSVGLNIPQLKSKLMKQLKQNGEVDGQLKEKMITDFKSTDEYLKQLETKKQGYENELKKYKPDSKPLEEKITGFIDSTKNIRLPEVERGKLSDTLGIYQDSLTKVSAYNRLLEDYNRTIYLYTKTKRKLDRLKSFFELNGESPDSLISDSLSSKIPNFRPSSLTEKLLMGIKSFDVGLVYPLFSDLTLKGLPVKGVNSSFVFPKYFVSLAVGKTLRLNAPNYVNFNPSPKFERNVVAIKGGIGNPDSTHFFVSAISFKDPNSFIQIDSANMLSPKSNFLFSFGGKLNASKKISFEGEIVTSDFRDAKAPVATESLVQTGVSNSFFMNRACFIKAYYMFSENSLFSVQHKIIGGGYISLGTPFLRRDYRETEVRMQQSFLDKKISATAFFKYNVDNLNHQKSYQNTLSGYGFTLKTKFRKAPNVVITHTPFEMNSEFKPTQFATNTLLPNLVNRFHLTTANVFYISKIAGVTSVINMGFLNNVIQNSSGQKFSQQSYTANINATLPKGNTITLTGGVYKTLPKVDSLNVRFIEGVTSFYLFKKVTATAGLSYHQNNPAMFKYGTFFQVSHAIKQFSITARGLINKLEENWGVGSNKEFNFFLGITYRL